MVRYLADRLLSAIPTIFIVSVMVFAIMYLLPGDPAALMLTETGASAEAIAKLRTELGLDEPAYVQYLNFISKAIRGDLGQSLRTNMPVSEMIRVQFPATIELAVTSLLIAIIVGGSLGIIAAVKHNTIIDTAAMAAALFGLSIPIFWSSLMLIFLFSVKLNWLPATGQGSFRQLIMPAAALGLTYAGLTSRLVRSSVLEVLKQDYVRTAHAKGLSERIVLLRHVLRSALIPVVTIIGIQIGNLLSGTMIIETIFARQGIGSMTVNAILYKDFRVVQGSVLFIAVMYILINLIVDFSYNFLDPRTRERS